MSKARKSFYFILPVFSILVGALLAELALALFYPIPYSLESNMYYSSDEYTGFAHQPYGSGSYPSGVDAVANSRGHRDDEVEVPKPEGVFRILLIGDSFTAGANVEQRDAYPQVLERLLNEDRLSAVPVNADNGPIIEVVNAGVGGWSPFQYAQYLEYYGEAFEPDLVLAGVFVGNDIFVERFAVEQTRRAVLGRRVKRDVTWDGWIAARIF
ncbi:MAG: SGNH/GDSL hydrolase family protein, partial [Gammaproteobacteria bacterium]